MLPMKKLNKAKLTVTVQTLRNLTEKELTTAAGGTLPSVVNSRCTNTMTGDCTTTDHS
jgi:hypothetical protein